MHRFNILMKKKTVEGIDVMLVNAIYALGHDHKMSKCRLNTIAILDNAQIEHTQDKNNHMIIYISTTKYRVPDKPRNRGSTSHAPGTYNYNHYYRFTTIIMII